MRPLTAFLASLMALAMTGSLPAEEVSDLVASGAEAKKVVGDCKFTEGPAYSPKGFLLFSDIPNSRIVKVDADGTVSDFLKPSGGSNGLMFDAAGNLYACQGTARKVVKINPQNLMVEPLCDSYDGKAINSPNDLALDGHGGLYFTDPRYGQDMKIDQPCMGVYYIDHTGKTTRVIDNRARPNGILVSTDQKTLYVAEPNKREVWSYEIKAPGSLGQGTLIFTGDESLDGGGPDGMALDAHGRIYATYKSIVVLKPNGELIGRIPVPEQPANCKFGGPENKTLYITARTSLYSLNMNVAGAPLAAKGPSPAPKVGLHNRMNGFRGPARLTQDKKEGAKDGETKEVEINDLKMKVPTTWKKEQATRQFRVGQFALPPAEGDKFPTDIVISYIPGGGGNVEDNLGRWTNQFAGEGRTAKTTTGECPQGTYVLHDVKGTYNFSAGGPFAGGKVEPRPDHRSISIRLTLKNKEVYYIRLTGPTKTVDGAAKAFRDSIEADASKEKPFEI